MPFVSTEPGLVLERERAQWTAAFTHTANPDEMDPLERRTTEVGASVLL